MPSEAGLAGVRGSTPLVFKQDPDLPISARREEILEILHRHQVVIVAGETGSGKSTQLPQYCLEMGLGIAGLIAHTQPRRLAARALANRISEELAQPLGAAVGFRVRFADRVSDATRLVLLTDGLLLAELTLDPLLRRYDCIIVDEAHERTLNIDLLLGVLKRLLPRRPELKLIVTSATLEVERVAKFFDDAPVVTVSGRGYPIEVRYAAESEDSDAGKDAEDPDLPFEVLNALRDIRALPGSIGDADVLVFLPGEREIRDVGDFLKRELSAEVEVLELYSRLPWDRQSRIFQRAVRRRIVLATNVAETSITVPGIRVVIDSGLARVSRYSPRNRLQRLPIESVSRASADQRKGRCGRLGPGLCVRLYTESDFAARPQFTEPEVLRTNLAALLLRLAADGLGEAESFAFIDPPDARALGDGYRLLQELEAIDGDRRITRRGRSMARLPLDPRLARALLESKRFHAQSELLAIVSGLSVPDARLAVQEGSAAPAAGKEFEDARSEFSSLVTLWRAYQAARRGPRRELRRWCKERGVSLLRLSEWEDVHAQVSDRAAELGILPQTKPASYTGVHRALLAGFCTMVGHRGEEGVYRGTRGVQFHLFPGSSIRRRRPRWVMAANIVETSRVFARRLAEVEPMWIEAAAQHLLKREFLEPDWDEEREEVIARERISFLGLVLCANRVVNFGPIAPEESRLIFAREAIVYQRLSRRPAWLRANDAALREGQRMEDRLRTRELVLPAEAFVEFYAKALPRQVSSAVTLDHFTRHLTAAQIDALRFGPEHIFARVPDPLLLARFPERVTLAAVDAIGSGPAAQGLPTSLPLPLVGVDVEYRFTPGDARDGASLRIPLLVLPLLTRDAVDAAVPGLAEPRLEALLRSLPKDARRGLIPIASTVADFIAYRGTPSTDLERLAEWLKEARGIPEALIRFDPTAVPAYLVPQLTVVLPEPADDIAAADRDLGQLRRRYASYARAELDRRARRAYPHAWRRFAVEELPRTIDLDVGDGVVRAWIALAGDPAGTRVGFEWSAEEALRTSDIGATQLARLMLERQSRDLSKSIACDTPLLLAASPYLRGAELADLLLQLSFRRACFDDGEWPRSRTAFEAALDRGREHLFPVLAEFAALVRTWFAAAREVRRLLDDPRAARHPTLVQESRSHLQRLLAADSLTRRSPQETRQVYRYLKAEQRRWQRLVARGGEPPQILRELQDWSARLRALERRVTAELRSLQPLRELELWIEEYRISLYAQEVGTSAPVSAARLTARAAAIEAWITR